MSDIELPTCIEDAFDFETKSIHAWEVEKIRKAIELDEIVIDQRSHLFKRATEHNINLDDVFHVVLNGKAKSKDLPSYSEERWEGINFEGALPNQKGKRLRIRVKVGWRDGFYEFGTVHPIK